MTKNNRLRGNIPSPASIYNCGLQIFDKFRQWSGIVVFSVWNKLFEIFSRFKNGHFKCIQLETPTIVFEDFMLKSMIFENFSTVFYKGLCKGRLGNSLFLWRKTENLALLCRVFL